MATTTPVVPKPQKRLSRPRSFKLPFPRLCRQAEASSPKLPRSCSLDSGDRHSELWKIFRLFDKDNDGKISSQELRTFFATMGEEASGLEMHGDCFLDFPGFVTLMETEKGQEEDLRKAFEVFSSAEAAGRITARGLQKVLRRLGDDRTVMDCEAMIRAYDCDGDGGLNFQEFRQMMS